MSPEFHDFTHCGDTFPPHADPPNCTGHDLIDESGFYEAA